MPNNFVFPNWVGLECLRLLKNKSVIGQFFNTKFRKELDHEFAVGESFQVKLPQRYTVRSGLGYSPQALNRLTTTINCDQIAGIDFEIDDLERALKQERSKKEISEQYLEPAMAQLNQELDSRCAQFAYQNINNIAGALGTDPATTTTIASLIQRMRELACPAGEKGLMFAPQAMTSLIPALQTLFNPASEISRQYKEGSLGKLYDMDSYISAALKRHTAGTWAGAVTVNGANQTGNTLAINCTAGDTFKKGDVFAIANMNQVNPMTRSLLSLVPKQIVVLADMTGVGGGNAADVLQISPAIFGPGSQYQNVDALAANSAALTLFPGTTSPNGKSGVQGLLLHREAFAIVGVKLYTPKAVEYAVQAKDPDTGIDIRLVDAWDPITSKRINRWDMVWGYGPLYPDNAAMRLLHA